MNLEYHCLLSSKVFHLSFRFVCIGGVTTNLRNGKSQVLVFGTHIWFPLSFVIIFPQALYFFYKLYIILFELETVGLECPSSLVWCHWRDLSYLKPFLWSFKAFLVSRVFTCSIEDIDHPIESSGGLEAIALLLLRPSFHLVSNLPYGLRQWATFRFYRARAKEWHNQGEIFSLLMVSQGSLGEVSMKQFYLSLLMGE